MRRVPYKSDTPETRRLKSIAALAAAAERRSRKRWYITIGIRPAPQKNQWPYYITQAWPILFTSEEAAWEYARSMTGFVGKGIWTSPKYGVTSRSYALSSVYLPKEAKARTEIVRLKAPFNQ